MTNNLCSMDSDFSLSGFNRNNEIESGKTTKFSYYDYYNILTISFWWSTKYFTCHKF